MALLASHCGSFENMMRRLHATRALERSLRGRIRIIAVTEPMQQQAVEAEQIWKRAYESADPVPCETSEYSDHFAEKKYARCGLEMNAEVAAALFSLCGLKAADRFIDLGSSEGRLPLAAAQLTPARAAIGIELSPSRHLSAIAAQSRLASLGLGGALSVFLGDILDESVLSNALAPGLSSTDVVWCAVQAKQGHRIAAQLLAAVQDQRRKAGAGPSTPPTRLLLAGFPLPDDAEGVTLHAGYVFVRSPPDASRASSSSSADEATGAEACDEVELTIAEILPLFGEKSKQETKGNPGPRVVLEYHVH